MISTEANMMLVINELSSASDEIIISLRSQSAWYVIMISAEANMILAMNEPSSTHDKMIPRGKTLTPSRAPSAWYVIVISAEANMMSVIKVSRKKSKSIVTTHTLLAKENKK